MIDVQPYIDKLEVLKEYMAIQIDSYQMGVVENIMSIFKETGMLVTYSTDLFITHRMTFEEYYYYRTKNIWI